MVAFVRALVQAPTGPAQAPTHSHVLPVELQYLLQTALLVREVPVGFEVLAI